MNPGQKRSYPFSDDENLADQQVNPDFNAWTKKLHIFTQENTLEWFFLEIPANKMQF